MVLYTFHLFAGAGGGILADLLLGHRPIGAVEIEPYARNVLLSRQLDGSLPRFPVWSDVRTFRADNPNTREFIDRLRGIRERLCICGGFPCFAKGTFILTADGYKPIENVVVGDSVLTHKGRWRRITAVMQRNDAEIWTVKGFGILKTETTGNHRYYIRRGESYEWQPVQDIRIGDYSTIPMPDVEDDGHSAEWWKLVGRYLADGWRVKRHNRKTDCGRIVIACCDQKYNTTAKIIKDAGYNFCPVRERTCWKLHITNVGLYRELEQFGKYAYGKTLNRKALCLPNDKARALFEGYMSGDGYNRKDGRTRTATTTSPALALGFTFIAKRLGENVGVYKYSTRAKCRIENRTCNCRDQYGIVLYNEGRQSFQNDKYVHSRIRKIEKTDRLDTVYNLSVEEDESYIANGAIVHNCQDISSAGKGEGIGGEKSGLWKEYARIIGEIRPKYAFLENSNMLIRRGLDVVVTDLAEMGYSMAWGIVSAADVGACHIRKRFWGVAKRERENPNPESLGLGTTRESCGSKKSIARPSDLCNNLSNSNSAREQGSSNRKDNEQEQFRPDELRGGLSDAGNENNGRLFGKQKESDEQSELDARGKTFDVRWQRREAESRLGGMADGISDWLDDCQAGTLWTPDEKGLPRITTTTENRASRLKAIGNAQVPLCAAVAFTMLKEILDNYDC